MTFLFTDIEGSTRALQALGHEWYVKALSDHEAIIRDAIATSGGSEVATEGDAFFAVFPSAASAVEAAVSAQRGLSTHAWPDGNELKVRMGLHTGDGRLRGDDYVGLDVHRAARVAAAGHGGQVLVSSSTAGEVRDMLPPGIALADLGRHVLKDLDAERLFQLEIDELRSEFPALRTLRAGVANLPLELTSFVGREESAAEIIRLLEERRLLTLTGPGGTGKTRLAAAVVSEVVGSFSDGAFFVALSGIRDPDLIATTVIEALGLRSTSGATVPTQQLISYLADRELVLILDNFEQLRSGASIVSEILQAGPGIRIIVTSRAPLHIHGEREVPVSPLSTTRAEDHLSEGARLFIDRATDVDSNLVLDETDIAAIEALVGRLDGLPLAIELAASKVKVLHPTAILERLGNHLLSDPGSDLPERHRTISGTIGWSYDLLDAWPQRLLARCSVFAATAGIDEIEAVCRMEPDEDSDVLTALAELVDHNLLYRSAQSHESRYGMLTVIGEFASQRLAEHGETQALEARHVQAYRRLVERAEPELLTSARAATLERLAADHDDIRAALDRAISTGDAESSLAIVSGMWRFWQTRGPLQEASRKVEGALALEGKVDASLRARALGAKGGIAYWRGEFGHMREPYEEAVSLLRTARSRPDLARALYDLSFACAGTGDHAAADEALAESLAISQEDGDAYGVARAHWGMFNIVWYQGQTDAALRFADLAIAGFTPLDAPFDLGWARFAQADSLQRLGRLEEAKAALDTAVPSFADTGDLSALVLFFEQYAALAIKLDQRRRAARMAGAAQRLQEQTGVRLSEAQGWRNINRATLEALGKIDTSLEAELQAGHTMDTSAAVAFALDG